MNAPPILNGFITRGEFARRVKRSPQRVTQMALAGDLEFIFTPLGRLFPKSEVDRILHERQLRKGEATKGPE